MITFLAIPCNSIEFDPSKEIDSCDFSFNINGISAKFLMSILNLLVDTNWLVISSTPSKYLSNHLDVPYILQSVYSKKHCSSIAYRIYVSDFNRAKTMTPELLTVWRFLYASTVFRLRATIPFSKAALCKLAFPDTKTASTPLRKDDSNPLSLVMVDVMLACITTKSFHSGKLFPFPLI